MKKNGFTQTTCLLLSLMYSLMAGILAADSNGKDLPKWFHFEMSMSSVSSPRTFAMHGWPLSVRAIPRHQYDGWLSGYPFANAPLPDTTVLVRQAPTGTWFVYWKPCPTIGLGFDLTFFNFNEDTPGRPQLGPDSPERFQMNQQGDSERGYGASLRYYEVTLGNKSIGLSAYIATPWLVPFRAFREKDSLDICARLKVGGVYDLLGAAINVESGYDRWNSDEVWQKKRVGRLHEHILFGALEVGLLTKSDRSPVALFIQVMAAYHVYAAREFHYQQIKPNQQWQLGFGAGIDF